MPAHTRDATAPSDTPADSPADAGTASTSGGDRLLLAVFWTWAVLLLAATLAHLFGWEGVLDALDVKQWFAR